MYDVNSHGNIKHSINLYNRRAGHSDGVIPVYAVASFLFKTFEFFSFSRATSSQDVSNRGPLQFMVPCKF